jgi:hypothetical protein
MDLDVAAETFREMLQKKTPEEATNRTTCTAQDRRWKGVVQRTVPPNTLI